MLECHAIEAALEPSAKVERGLCSAVSPHLGSSFIHSAHHRLLVYHSKTYITLRSPHNHHAFPIPPEVLQPKPQGLWRQHRSSHARSSSGRRSATRFRQLDGRAFFTRRAPQSMLTLKSFICLTLTSFSSHLLPSDLATSRHSSAVKILKAQHAVRLFTTLTESQVSLAQCGTSKSIPDRWGFVY
jgi:hypothetical protein